MTEFTPVSLLRLLIKALIVLVCLYNVLLGAVLVVYFMATELLVKRGYADVLAVGVGFILGLFTVDMHAIIAQPVIVWQLYHEHGLYELLNYQMLNWQLVYAHGLFVVALPTLLLQVLCDWQSKQYNSQANAVVATNMVNALADGTLIGDSYGQPVIVEDKELNQHCLIVGTTGSGKTTTILNFVESAARRNLPVIYLDGKGSFDLVDRLQKIADRHGRVLKVFCLRMPNDEMPSLAGYNPFSSGGATEWKNRIMSLFAQAEGRGQEHFSLGEQNYINFVANVLAKLNKPVDLRMLLGFLEQPDKLLAVAHEVDAVMGAKLAKLHNDSDISKLVRDVVKLLELFIYSDYGSLFATKGMERVIRLKESILNNEMVLFLFDASAYPEDTRKVAKMVINDLNSSISDMRQFTKCFCVFDEFASYASDNLAETISLQRSNGMHAIIGTQSITTVKLKAADTKRIAEELIACCNTYIVQAVNHAEDAEILAKVMGTRKTYEVTSQIDSKQGGSTGLGSVKRVDEFKIHPQMLKDLRQGEAVIYRKAAWLDPVQIKVVNNG